MDVINIEIKARCKDPELIRTVLKLKNAILSGTDHQTDTYFIVNSGRLKLREGNIENNLIFYHRDNVCRFKKSDCILYRPEDSAEMKKILAAALGVKVIVNKRREIYYLENVKIHIDLLDTLGSFVEIEANQEGDLTETDLHEQCDQLIREFNIHKEDLISESYSDMILKSNQDIGSGK